MLLAQGQGGLAIFRKKKQQQKTNKKNLHCSSPLPRIYQWSLMYLHTIVGYYNIWIKFNFQVLGARSK